MSTLVNMCGVDVTSSSPALATMTMTMNDNDNEIFLFNIIIDYVTVRIHTFQVCQLSAEFHYVYERYNIELK